MKIDFFIYLHKSTFSPAPVTKICKECLVWFGFLVCLKMKLTSAFLFLENSLSIFEIQDFFFNGSLIKDLEGFRILVR